MFDKEGFALFLKRTGKKQNIISGLVMITRISAITWNARDGFMNAEFVIANHFQSLLAVDPRTISLVGRMIWLFSGC